MPSILIVDDEPFYSRLLAEALSAHVDPRVVVTAVVTPAQAISQRMAMGEGDVLWLVDWNLRADIDGLELLARVAQERPHDGRFLMTGYVMASIPQDRLASAEAAFEKPTLLHPDQPLLERSFAWLAARDPQAIVVPSRRLGVRGHPRRRATT